MEIFGKNAFIIMEGEFVEFYENGNVYIKHAPDGTINMTHLNKIVIKPGKTKVFYLRCDEYNNGYKFSPKPPSR